MIPIKHVQKLGTTSRWLSGGWLDSLSFLLLAVLLVVYVAMLPALLDTSQIGLQLQAGMPLILLACGECLVIMLGGVDLSVGGVCSLASALVATQSADFPGGPGLAALCIIGIGIMAGVINGILVTYGGLVPFIATLATWSIWGGLALVILPTDGGTVPTEFTDLAVGSSLGLANSIWLVVALAAAWFVFRRTPFAARLYAVGGDEARAKLRGIDSYPVKIVAFSAAGGFAAAAGLYISAATTTGLSQAGDPLILTGIAAIVIGGTSLAGGAGGLGLTILGALILLTLAGVVAAFGLTPTFTYVVSSLLLICMVSIRHIASRRGAR
jgi:ribose transport system permease protein